VTGTFPMVVEPVFESRCGRTWLTYPEFCRRPDQAGDGTAGIPDLVHGVVVFKDTSFDTDRRRWLERAKADLEEGVAGQRGTLRPDRIVVPKQVHSAEICHAGSPGSEERLESEQEREPAGEIICDGLVTGALLVMVGVTVADCVPLLAVNEKARVAGVAHCGWRGTAAGIVGNFVDALERPGATGADQAATRYLIGPSIGQCCYEVGDDMLAHFSLREREAFVSRRAGGDSGRGGVFFDLKAAVAARLMARGVPPGQICVDNTCTSCQQYKLSSYRAGGRDCGRMLAFVMLTRRG